MKTNKVGIWLRVSTKMQVEETDSLEHHEVRAKAYCEAKGWKVVEIYRLEGISGKDIYDHPVTQKMLEDIASGKIDTLVFSSLSRLARNTRQLLKISDVFRTHGASLVSLKESIDTSSPAGRLFFTVISALASFESEEISSRVKASVITRAKMGKTTGGAGSFGYRWNDGVLETVPEEAVILKELFDIFLETKRIKTTARLLNNKGYRTRKGKEFKDTAVRRLLTNPIAKGLRRANYTEQGANGTAIIKSESEWIYAAAPAVVSEEVYDRANAILNSAKRAKKPPARIPVHPFSGLVYCCCSDEKMRVYTSTPKKYTCPKCRAKIPKEDLEEIYKSQLQQFMLSPNKLKNYFADVNETIADKQKQLGVLKYEQAKLQAETKKLYDLYMADSITAESFGDMNAPIEERSLQLKTAIPKLEAEIDIANQQLLDHSQTQYEGQNLFDKWNGFSNDEKVSIIANLTESIHICRDEIEIKFRFIPSVLNGGNKATNRQGLNAAMS